MDGKKNPISEKKYKRKHSGLSIWTVLLIVFAVILTAGGALAKYIASNRQRAEMESSQFHISSNYLEESDTTSYAVVDWGDGFDILLYNYEKENIAQISGVDMVYTVTPVNAAVSVKDQAGNALTTEAAGGYQFPVNTGIAHHVIHVTPKADIRASEVISITVQATSPYHKTLKANFTIQNNSKPDYTVTDKEDGTVLITVKTNDYQDSMTVTWDPAKFSPDNTNVLMASWKDESPTDHFSVSRNSTYELLFFKNTGSQYTEKTGTGTEIKLE